MSFLLRDNLKIPPLALLLPMANLKAKEKSGNCVHKTTKSQCSRGDKCGIKYDPEKKRVPKGKSKFSRPSSSLRRNSLKRGTPLGKSLSRKETQSTCFFFFFIVMVRNETPLITGIHLSAPVSVKGVDHRRSGRIDGGSNSVHQRIGCLCHHDAVGRFTSSDTSVSVVHRNGVLL